MNKRNWISMVGALMFGTLVLLAGCSGEKEEAGVVEQASDKVAGKAAEYINKPLDNAKESQEMQNVQAQNMEDVLEEGDTETETEIDSDTEAETEINTDTDTETETETEN